MSRYWGYNKRPENWKSLLKEISNDTQEEEEANQPIPKPKPKPIPKQIDSSTTHL